MPDQNAGQTAVRYTVPGLDTAEERDPVTQDMLIAQTAQLEQYQWFVRAHLENSSGQLRSGGEHTEEGAAEKARS